MEIREIRDEVKANGKTLKLVKSKQISDDRMVGIYCEGPYNYEVHLLRLSKKHPRDKDDSYSHVWAHPNNEQWGSYGWTYQTLSAALVKYDSLK